MLARLNIALGRAVAWLTVAMVLVTGYVVIARYWFSSGEIWVQESVTWMHAAVFMLAAAYTLARDEHVRVDIFYGRMTARQQALVNAAGTVVFLWPVCALMIYTSWDYVSISWSIQEGSREAGGLGYPFPSLLKSMIPVSAGLLALQGLSDLLAALGTLRRSPPA